MAGDVLHLESLALRSIRCTHPDYEHRPVTVDFKEFWEGAPNRTKSRGLSGPSIGYSGRPVLAEQLFPVIRASCVGLSPRRALL